ncbi:hypothetical protein JQ636_38660 [Bradyrhizobium japonicum]|uniref:hypothetical protein n=1 Tax=Bradyrhizobium japonicum TaxID=375 RepID=UPI001BA74452|nr:hypothetical protein [Bradyrhizobium japonicum]MBR0809485.1 hypothetical protein [Bradyrhizobium japonicum]MCS4131948.1 hypothetical protein [Bradyrhizobium japonicum]
MTSNAHPPTMATNVSGGSKFQPIFIRLRTSGMRSRALSDSRLLGVDPINPDGDGETIPGSHVRFWRKPEARFVAATSEKIGCSA